MRKLVLMSLMVLGTAPAFAKVGGAGIVTSDFIWRGLSLTHGPAVQGMMTFTHDDTGLTAGIFGSNQAAFKGGASSNNLLNPFIVAGYPMGDTTLTLMLMYYNFSPDASSSNGLEATLGAQMGGAKFSIAYMPTSVQSIGKVGTKEYNSSDMYFNLTYKHDFEKDLAAVVAVGYTMFSEPNNIDTGYNRTTATTAASNLGALSNYADYKVAIQKSSADGMTLEIGYTDTPGLNAAVSKYASDLSGGTTAAGSSSNPVRYQGKTYVSLTKAF
jgi:hypothetical protein